MSTVHVFGEPERILKPGDRICTDDADPVEVGEIETVFHVDAIPAGDEWFCPRCGEYTGLEHDA